MLFQPVFPAAELAPGCSRLVTIGGKDIAVFNVRGTFHAMEDTCLHAGGPLHEGRLKGKTVTCPWHEWRFDVTNGKCDLNPIVALTCYPVRVRDGQVEINASGR